MSTLNWGMIEDGGAFESLMHAILYNDDPGIILFGRLGKDAGQDARSADGLVVCQAKYSQSMTMDYAVKQAIKELETIKKYRQPEHNNYQYWQNVHRWVLVANFRINPNDDTKWQTKVVPAFKGEGLTAEYWGKEILEAKLASHPHIRDVFFAGENRVLVGLKEAHELLIKECIGSDSLEKPLIGRKAEMQAICDFAKSTDKSLLPVVGSGGSGKSRLLYESLVILSMDGWRVFWALPETIARSSSWFHLLNGSRKTCVAIDNPDDPGLLGAVIEQLQAVERRSWKVIVACRSEKAKMLQRFRNNCQVADLLRLGSLDEPGSKQLLKALLWNQRKEAWLHNIYTYTHGFPGWLCLVAQLTNRKGLPTLPERVDEVASIYLDSCLQSIDTHQRDTVQTLLRWLALWGVLNLEGETSAQSCLNFLNENGVPDTIVRELLSALVSAGIVRNWGVGKRFYALEPLIIREHVLSDWLLLEERGTYRVSDEGKDFINRLVKGQVPLVDKILGTLSHLTLSRLDESDGFSFLKPIFDDLATIAKDGNILDQYQIIHLVEKAGAADPESALDVLISIREAPKETMEVDVPPWGSQTFTHASVLSKLPWILYQIAEYVFDDIVARRYLAEFRELVALQDSSIVSTERGKGAAELLERLLCGSRNSGTFTQPARKIAEKELEVPPPWSFIDILLKSLLNPEREYTEWAANWTIVFSKETIVPGSVEWEQASGLRAKLIKVLETTTDTVLRSRLWYILAESHHQFHRMVLHGWARETIAQEYRSVLINDLTICASTLESPPVKLTIEEATHARHMWSWYLKYGRDDDPLDQARQCEHIYNALSSWRFHALFRFGETEELTSETERVVAILEKAPNVQIFIEFFSEAKRYLDVVRRTEGDGVARSCISAIADALADQFIPAGVAPQNALTSFVTTVLGQNNDNKDLAWNFAVRICRKYLRRKKETGDHSLIVKELQRLLGLTPAKPQLLYDLYSYAHPASIGIISGIELDCIFEHENEFSDMLREWFMLLGTFALVRWEMIQSRLSDRLNTMRNQPVEASRLMERFIDSLYWSVLKYKWSSIQIQTAWIIDMIVDFGLDGALFEMYEFTWLRDKSHFTLNMPQLEVLVRSRMELEQRPKPDDSFKIIPYDFRINDWCSFDETNPEEVSAFYEFCRLGLGRGFTSIHWMPKYVAQLDPSGRHVATFIEQHLKENACIGANVLARLAYLASDYPNTSEPWTTIARPICRNAERLRREEREQVYFGLSSKETGVLSSMPGEVPDHYRQRFDEAAGMFKDEPPNSPLMDYRKWNLRHAEADLKREQEYAEEDFNG